MEEQLRVELEYLRTDEEGYRAMVGFEARDVVAAEESYVGGWTGEASRVAQHVVTVRSPLGSSQWPFPLYPPQAALAAMMLRIENEHSWLDCPRLHARSASAPACIQSNVGLVSERKSFGKSTLIAALIQHQPTCQWVARECEALLTNGPRRACGPPGESCNVVVVAKSTMREWRQRLDGFFVETPASLNACVAALWGDSPPTAVVVRAGTMKHRGEPDLVLNHFVRAVEGLTFSRAFYDDYDLLGIMPTRGSRGALMPLARFHWFLSATARPREIFTGEGAGTGTLDSVGALSGAIREALFGTRCDSGYSQLEFDVPPIRWLTATDAVAAVRALVVGGTPKMQPFKRKTTAFIGGTTSVPYDYAVHGCKILVSVEDKEARRALAAELAAAGVEATLLDHRNLHLFETSSAPVGISRLLHGVNMGYLTHVVVPSAGEYDAAAIDQMVGRAQRIGRRHDLQVLVVPSEYERGYTLGLGKPITSASMPETSDYARGFNDAMRERGRESSGTLGPAPSANAAFLEGYLSVFDSP